VQHSGDQREHKCSATLHRRDVTLGKYTYCTLYALRDMYQQDESTLAIFVAMW